MDFQTYTDEVEGFVARGNYHAALNIALSGLNECRRNKDQAGIAQCLGVILGVVNALANEFGSREFRRQQ